MQRLAAVTERRKFTWVVTVEYRGISARHALKNYIVQAANLRV